MRRRLDEISTFVQVIEAGSFTEAARRLGLAKSVVSKRIADLEDTLAVKLLHRSTRRLVATDAGTAFYERSRRILAELDEAVEEVAARKQELFGGMRIAAPMSFGTMYLGAALYPFLLQHPRLELALDLNDRVVDILGEGYDLGIRIGRLSDSSLIARKLAVSRRVLCCSPDYAARRGLPGTPEELKEHDCIGYANISATQLWQFAPAKPGGDIRALAIRSRFVANNGEIIGDAAIAGLGIAAQPMFLAAAALKSGKLVAIPGIDLVPDTIYAVYPPGRHLSEKVRAVIELLAKAFDPPPWER